MGSIATLVLVALSAGSPKVDAATRPHLAAWEQAMAARTSFLCGDVRVTRKDLPRKTEKAFTGTIQCLKPRMGRLRLDPLLPDGGTRKPTDYEAYIWNDKSLIEYDAAIKEVHVFPLTPTKADPAPTEVNPILAWLGSLIWDAMMAHHDLLNGVVGGEWKGVAWRFDVKLVKEDAHYVHLELKPRFAKDRWQYDSIQVVLFGPNVPKPYVAYLPCVLTVRHRGRLSETVWQFSEPKINVPTIKREDFELVVPDGWTVQQPAPKK